MTRFGGYAQLAATDHRACAVIPDDLPLGEAAALATQGCTAWYAAMMLCALQAGQRVLIHSAAGGVGQLLVQLALRRGCEVFAIASGEEKMIYLRSLGVQHPIDRSRADYAKAVQLTLKGNSLDVSFNAVGGASYRKDMRLLGTGGRIVLYGGAERGTVSGIGTLRFVWRMGLLIPIFLMIKSRSVLGLNMLRISDDKPEIIAECLREVVAAYRSGILHPHVHGEFPAAELPQAQAALAGGRTMGKVAVRW
jgi:NADPH2:quinone reductase